MAHHCFHSEFYATVGAPSFAQYAKGGNDKAAAGNMTHDGFHTYTYDAEGNITAADSGSTATYAYDAMNHRVRAVTSSAGYEYLFDYAGRRISTWLLNQPGLPAGYGEEGRIYWNGTQIAFRDLDGTTYFSHKDWVGTERARTNYTGAVASSYASLPFGDGYTPNVVMSSGDQDNSHFSLLDYDSESATSHAQYRQYNPAQGRWMRPDPYSGSYRARNPQSFNRYAYVLNNPLVSVDPLGLDGDGNVPCPPNNAARPGRLHAFDDGCISDPNPGDPGGPAPTDPSGPPDNPAPPPCDDCGDYEPYSVSETPDGLVFSVTAWGTGTTLQPGNDTIVNLNFLLPLDDLTLFSYGFSSSLGPSGTPSKNKISPRDQWPLNGNLVPYTGQQDQIGRAHV